MPDTDSTPPPTSEEVQQRAVRHGPVTVRGTSREDGAYCIWCKEPWPCFDYRLADAYMVVVEVAERLGDGWYPDEAYGLPVWSLDVHDSTRDEYVTEYEPMPPAHAAFLRSIREPQEMRDGTNDRP